MESKKNVGMQNNSLWEGQDVYAFNLRETVAAFRSKTVRVSIVTHQSSKELDAEEKMFLDLALHFRVFTTDEWVRQQG